MNHRIFLPVLFLVFFDPVLSASLPPNCAGTLTKVIPKSITDASGTISSPGFEDNEPYPENIMCVWKFSGSPDYYTFKFKEFDLDETGLCQGDQLEILSLRRSSMHTFCGNQKPRDLYLDEQEFLVIFTSDLIYSGRGFQIEYESRPEKVPRQGYFQCRNREWVSNEKVCDGKMDCADGWDESECREGMPIPEFACGAAKLNTVRPDSLTSRILGGQEATEGSWPWQVSLQIFTTEPNGHYCGGSLIHPQFVVTAAHCVDGMSKDDIRVGLGFNHRFKRSGHEQIRYAKFAVIYPDIVLGIYSDHQIDMMNDIALIMLNAPVTLTDYVSPICYTSAVDIASRNFSCFVTGWGDTKGTGSSAVLKQLPVKKVPREMCGEKNEGPSAESQVCVQSGLSGTGVCSGDSGGPLVCNIDGKWEIIGVASRVLDATIDQPVCGVKDGGAVYSSIQTKARWIQRIMNILQKA